MKETLVGLIPGPVRRPLSRLVAPYRWTGDATNQWLRIVMNRETDRLVESLNPSGLKVLEISGRKWDRPGYFKEYRSIFYPEYDVCDQPLSETFDLIIAEQVFEHLLRPYRAAGNVYQMLRPNGAFLITTPFMIPIHNEPYDCTRWSETGMRHFLTECGFPLDGITSGSWGNLPCVRANLDTQWRIYQRWRHSLKNDPVYPCVVWALARKPVAA
jgi:SAM-dependent methyltransferase